MHYGEIGTYSYQGFKNNSVWDKHVAFYGESSSNYCGINIFSEKYNP